MSNKYCGLVVTFENEVSEEYIEILKNTIMSFKGVVSVEAKVFDIDHEIARQQAKHELRSKIFGVLK